jgi:hypothetical protein
VTKLKIRVEQHLERWKPYIFALLQSERRDLDVIAIVLTETFFRPKQIRLLEFLSFKILSFLGCSRANIVSLGMGQVQARHWRMPITLFRILSPMAAYDVTIRYWEEHRWLGLPLPKKIARHVGELRFYYLEIAIRCRDEAQKWARHLRNHQPV